MQSKFWCVTVNNPIMILDPSEWPGCTSAIWQLEMGDSGTVHYQVYVEFRGNMRLNRVVQFRGLQGGHAERRMGNKAQAVVYHTKEDTRLEGPFFWPNEQQARQGGISVLRRNYFWTDLMLDMIENTPDIEI